MFIPETAHYSSEAAPSTSGLSGAKGGLCQQLLFDGWRWSCGCRVRAFPASLQRRPVRPLGEYAGGLDGRVGAGRAGVQQEGATWSLAESSLGCSDVIIVFAVNGIRPGSGESCVAGRLGSGGGWSLSLQAHRTELNGSESTALPCDAVWVQRQDSRHVILLITISLARMSASCVHFRAAVPTPAQEMMGDLGAGTPLATAVFPKGPLATSA